MLYLGTMFAPVKDRGGAGKGFTHKPGDIVSISTPSLGTLTNRVRLATECPPWTYGASHLLRDLARRGCCRLDSHPAKWNPVAVHAMTMAELRVIEN